MCSCTSRSISLCWQLNLSKLIRRDSHVSNRPIGPPMQQLTNHPLGLTFYSHTTLLRKAIGTHSKAHGNVLNIKVQGFFICHIIVIQGITRSEMQSNQVRSVTVQNNKNTNYISNITQGHTYGKKRRNKNKMIMNISTHVVLATTKYTWDFAARSANQAWNWPLVNMKRRCWHLH